MLEKERVEGLCSAQVDQLTPSDAAAGIKSILEISTLAGIRNNGGGGLCSDQSVRWNTMRYWSLI